jgi:hypothetical protein
MFRALGGIGERFGDPDLVAFGRLGVGQAAIEMGRAAEGLASLDAAHATGACLIAEQDGQAARGVLRRAWTAWQELDAPYEAAQVRVLLGLALIQLGIRLRPRWSSTPPTGCSRSLAPRPTSPGFGRCPGRPPRPTSASEARLARPVVRVAAGSPG